MIEVDYLDAKSSLLDQNVDAVVAQNFGGDELLAIITLTLTIPSRSLDQLIQTRAVPLHHFISASTMASTVYVESLVSSAKRLRVGDARHGSNMITDAV